MCIILKDKLKEKTFTGYKVVIKSKRGRYYSPSTGIEYKIKEPIKGTNKRYKKMLKVSEWVDPFNSHNGIFLMDNYFGRTSIFVNYKDAKFENTLGTTIVKITLSNDLRKGKYATSLTNPQGTKVVSGKFIENIETIKNK